MSANSVEGMNPVTPRETLEQSRQSTPPPQQPQEAPPPRERPPEPGRGQQVDRMA